MLNIKKTLTKVLQKIKSHDTSISSLSSKVSQPPIKAIGCADLLYSITSGTKTITYKVDVPSGYAIVPNQRPLSLYVSGDVNAKITDRSDITINGNKVTFDCYLWNPDNTSGISWGATLLCYKT